MSWDGNGSLCLVAVAVMAAVADADEGSVDEAVVIGVDKRHSMQSLGISMISLIERSERSREKSASTRTSDHPSSIQLLFRSAFLPFAGRVLFGNTAMKAPM